MARSAGWGRAGGLVVDLENARVRFAVLERGGLLGLGAKRFAYALSAFSRAGERDAMVLDVAAEALDRAKGFGRQRWAGPR